VIDEALHTLARILLRVCSPQRTHGILTRVGGALTPHRDRAAVKRARARMQWRGTCLSRALALAARTPGADLVIGVAPNCGVAGLFAHAWVEIEHEPLDPSDRAGTEIARLRRGSAIGRSCVARAL
jgi:hypothetical protein